MNIETYSPALVLLFAFALLCIMMDIHIKNLTSIQKWAVPIFVLALAVFNHMLRVRIGSPAYGKTITFTMHIPFFLLFLYLTRCGVIKMAFMILSAMIFTAPAVIVSNFVEIFLPPTSPVMLISNIISYGLILLFVYFVFKKGFNYLLRYGDNKLFLLFSIIPVIYYIYVFAAMNITYLMPWTVSAVIVRYFPTLAVFLFYFLLMYNYRSLSEKRDMEAAQTVLTQQLNGAEKQVAMLSKSQTQTAVYQHDMRHHLNMIDSLIASGKTEQAEEYIKKVQTDIEAITPKRYCENETVNLICSSFADRAERMGVKLIIEAKLPDNLPISDTELCSVISNGLENALRAVNGLERLYKKVEFYCGIRLNKLLLEIKNPYKGDITIVDGLPVSTKPGHGYGCRSIRTIAENCGGMCEFSAENDVFKMQVILPAKGVQYN